MKVASMTAAAISHGFTPATTSADWSGGAVAVEAIQRVMLLGQLGKRNYMHIEVREGSEDAFCAAPRDGFQQNKCG
jgi:hypothetical protein